MAEYSREEPCLSSSDLKVVYKELFDVRAKWRRIGIELNLTPGTLDAIRQMESDPAERLERVLLEWMNKGSATWRELVDTLYSVPVGETKLAELLEQKYHCFQSTDVSHGEVGIGKKRGRNVEDEVQQLNSDIRTMERKFARLQLSIRESLKERNVPCMKLVDHLMAYRYLHSVLTDKSTLCLSNQQSDLEKAENIDNIFRILTPFWSFLDFELLEDIISDRTLGADGDRQRLDEYSTSLKEFLYSWKVDAYEVCLHTSESLDSKVKLRFKLDTDSLAIYRDVKAAIARILDVQVCALQLYSIQEGCVELSFLCHDMALKVPFCQQQLECLSAMRPTVLWVKLEESVLFELSKVKQDIITMLCCKGIHHIAYKILSYLDAKSMCRGELVCKEWFKVINNLLLWKKLIETKVATDTMWKVLSEWREWGKYLFHQVPQSEPQYYRKLYPVIINDVQWKNGYPSLTRIVCHSEIKDDKVRNRIYCLRYDDKKIVVGARDNTIKVYDRHTLECTDVLRGHAGEVVCLQFDDNILVTGSTDSTIRVWDLDSGEILNILEHHSGTVLHLKFKVKTMVTGSKTQDRTVAVWDMRGPKDIVLHHVLANYGMENAVDFDDRYIVSGSGGNIIRVWRTFTGKFVHKLKGHTRGIACLQYRGNHILSGSHDTTIRIWDVELGICLRILEGHSDMVRCLRFDDRRIVSGCYDGSIKVWDFQAALDPKTPANTICWRTLQEHTGKCLDCSLMISRL